MPLWSYTTLLQMAAFITLLVAACYDIRTFRIPNALTFPVMAAGLAASLVLSPTLFFSRALSIVILFFFGMTGLMGMGDLKLCMAITALCGFFEMLYMVLAACVAMLVYCIMEDPKRAAADIGATFQRLRFRLKVDDTGARYPFSFFLLIGFVISRAVQTIL